MLIATYPLLSDFSLDHPLPESCMAANWNAGRAIASLGKRAVRHSAALRDPSVSVSAVTPRHISTQAAAATNSASVVDKTTAGCFLEDHDTAPPIGIKTYPDALSVISITSIITVCEHFLLLACRTKAYSTVYEKNVDDQVRPSLVPDDLIPPKSDKYWAPDPQTAVFGPAAEQAVAGESSFPTSPIKGGVKSVLEEKAWFRPTSLEDLEKPNHP